MENIVEETVVTITFAELEKLREDSFRLECLHNFGVSSWRWYEEAMSEFYQQTDEDE